MTDRALARRVRAVEKRLGVTTLAVGGEGFGALGNALGRRELRRPLGTLHPVERLLECVEILDFGGRAHAPASRQVLVGF